jgi:hypothetical protein
VFAYLQEDLLRLFLGLADGRFDLGVEVVDAEEAGESLRSFSPDSLKEKYPVVLETACSMGAITYLHRFVCSR